MADGSHAGHGAGPTGTRDRRKPPRLVGDTLLKGHRCGSVCGSLWGSRAQLSSAQIPGGGSPAGEDGGPRWRASFHPFEEALPRTTEETSWGQVLSHVASIRHSQGTRFFSLPLGLSSFLHLPPSARLGPGPRAAVQAQLARPAPPGGAGRACSLYAGPARFLEKYEQGGGRCPKRPGLPRFLVLQQPQESWGRAGQTTHAPGPQKDDSVAFISPLLKAAGILFF